MSSYGVPKLIGRIFDGDLPPEDGACAETDPELFFPEKGGSTREAKAICRGCEALEECLAWALRHDERFGVWGGTSTQDRARIVNARQEALSPGVSTG